MKHAKISLLILATLSFFSCLIYKQELNIFSDGSATLNMSYSIDRKNLQDLNDLNKALRNSAGNSTINYFNEEEIKGYLDSFEDIKSHSVRVHSDQKRTYVDIKIEISNLRNVLNAGLIPYARLSKNEDNWRFSYSTPYDFGEVKDRSARTRINQIQMKLTINTPSDIVSSSKEDFSKRSVVWKFTPKDKKQVSDIPNSFFVEFSGEKISFD
ncbi:hypothetical protein PQO01_17845 [Lentisphaera marina]|uniref:hypothetical protein n=1 Tax=Lentisphaera marina TaxID=1111041 RepID=UPI0023661CB8|nr:hypothetical protein [Lentisphaera marina]MDD7986817.1 hypothetical protein [Lentisphaera marina]